MLQSVALDDDDDDDDAAAKLLPPEQNEWSASKNCTQLFINRKQSIFGRAREVGKEKRRGEMKWKYVRMILIFHR